MALEEKKIREKIQAIIKEICPDAKVLKRNPHTSERKNWIGMFRHEVPGENGEKKIAVHAWYIRRTSVRKAVKSGVDQYTFEIHGFHGYDFGTDADNSEDRWQQIIDSIAEKFADKDPESDVWEFEDGDDEVTTEEVEFPLIGLVPISDTAFVHFGGGRLVVNYIPC